MGDLAPVSLFCNNVSVTPGWVGLGIDGLRVRFLGVRRLIVSCGELPDWNGGNMITALFFALERHENLLDVQV